MNDSDMRWMQRALTLAGRGRGLVEPNPLVGAVVVRDDKVVGEGWHQRFGGAHAEVFALNAAGTAAQGATLYVTLEPCCHYGKTPPCSDAVVAAGVARVVAAQQDPYPRVAGGGFAVLRAAGIQVDVGVCAAEARRLNAPYLTLLRRGRPHIHAKWAMTLDGKIATRTGDSKWISNDASRRRVHELRGRMDAILVGVGTVLADDPQLTARPPGPRTALRVVLDSGGRMPVTANILRTGKSLPTLIATTEHLASEIETAWRAAGCEVLRLPASAGRPSLPALLAELGTRRLTNLLVEGGSSVLGSFRDAGLIDEVHVFIAPRLTGGHMAPGPMAGLGVSSIVDSMPVEGWELEQIEGDVLLHGWVERDDKDD